jgi:hypothetical protein
LRRQTGVGQKNNAKPKKNAGPKHNALTQQMLAFSLFRVQGQSQYPNPRLYRSLGSWLTRRLARIC